MTDPVFVDTNVLVFARDLTEAAKQVRAAKWMAGLWASRRGRLSYQVLHEYYVTATRKLNPPRTADEARGDVTAFLTWRPIHVDAGVLDTAWAVEDRYGFSWWDALIVAAASAANCRWLLTEDLQDGQEVLGMTVLDPFRHPPAAVLGG